MIESEVDVVQWISDLMRDCRGEATNHNCLLCVVKLRLKFARTSELDGHIVEEVGQLAHLITSFADGNPKRKVAASDAPRRARQGPNWTREAPNHNRSQASPYQQN